jgi:VanZ like family
VSSGDSVRRSAAGFRIEPLRGLVALLYMGGVLSLSALPGRMVSRWGFSVHQLDLLHIPLFAGLAMVTLWAIVAPRVPRALCVLLAVTLFGGGDEILQLWVPGRVASFADFARDGLGAAIGVAFSEAVRPVAVALREWGR